MNTVQTAQSIMNQPPGEKHVLRLMPAIMLGLGIFAAMSAIPVGLGFVSHGLGMSALAVLALAGLSFGYRGGILSALGATFTALIPAAMAVGGADDFKTTRRTTVVEIATADAPRNAEAQVLFFKDARVATEFTHIWTGRRPSGGQEVHYALAPVVPQDWQPGMPVPAWRACNGGDAAWCTQALAYPMRAAQRVAPADTDAYRPGLDAMAQRFGLVSAPGAPLLHLTTPPAERADGALTGMILMPVLGFAVWLVGLLAWRGLGRLRRLGPG